LKKRKTKGMKKMILRIVRDFKLFADTSINLLKEILLQKAISTEIFIWRLFAF